MSEGNGYVTREQLLAPLVRELKDVEIEGLGKVQIQTISELERARMEAPNYTKKGTLNSEKLGDARCRLCVVGLARPQLSMGDVLALRSQDSRIINRLSEAIADHCGISQADMEELEKKAETPAGSSG